ncbi:hypothetical protein L0Z22_38035 [Burkholderia cepacia]|nr:hypothetical protein [Burkholderia cepacia]UQO39373.1 hypothetical protein L0Z22_38035 [Burkholderia cepacia]UQO49778.1 hypothetical protein L0Z05_17855 [Burkholderia cepacia]UQP09455.1 hypothetical protein L0Z01_38020 [Burkholderia cepacia]
MRHWPPSDAATTEIFGRADVPADPGRHPDIEPRRFGFIARNYVEDASQALSPMQGTVLAVWGALDRNADPADGERLRACIRAPAGPARRHGAERHAYAPRTLGPIEAWIRWQ